MKKRLTQIESAKKGIITKEMRFISKEESVSSEFICKGISQGKIIILHNKIHSNSKPVGIGFGLKTKVNANIGTSERCSNLNLELKKLKAAIDAKADAVMDLSTGGDLNKIRKEIIKSSSIPVGTVPIYQAAIEAQKKYGSTDEMREDEIFDVIEMHAKDGVDFITVHCGVTTSTIDRLNKNPRLMNVVSRGGALLMSWITKNKKENPLYKNFDRLIDIARKYDIVLSLGDGMRPGTICDSTDPVQIHELILLGQLAKRAREAGVQAMIEGPGHIPIKEIEINVLLEKVICDGAPFYVLGPLPTDIASGYDHITSAIGGAIAGSFGADFLCYVTPSEHLGLPTVLDVKEGVIAAKIAAHISDISKKIPGAIDWDRDISKARRDLDWKTQIKLSIDPKKAKEIYERNSQKGKDVCTMCGEYCSLKVMKKLMKK